MTQIGKTHFLKIKLISIFILNSLSPNLKSIYYFCILAKVLFCQITNSASRNHIFYYYCYTLILFFCVVFSPTRQLHDL